MFSADLHLFVALLSHEMFDDLNIRLFRKNTAEVCYECCEEMLRKICCFVQTLLTCVRVYVIGIAQPGIGKCCRYRYHPSFHRFIN